MAATLVAVGGINLDLRARSLEGIFRRATSNPSRISYAPGGVARNVAAAAARLGTRAVLLGAVGTDPLSDFVLRATAEEGVDVSLVTRVEDISVGTYLALVGAAGGLEVGASDMRAVDRFDRQAATACREAIAAAAVVVVDANLSVDAMRTVIDLANRDKVPVLVDPVSVAKARKLAAVGGRVFAVKPNEDEELVIRDFAARAEGPVFDYIVTSRGDAAVRLFDAASGETSSFPVRAQAVEDSTGAGDAFVAGLAVALADGASVHEAVRHAIETAARRLTGDPPGAPAGAAT